MNKIFIGIDNGTSGTIGVITNDKKYFLYTPIIQEQSYTKAKNIISRINVTLMKNVFCDIVERLGGEYNNVYCLIERPMVNPKRFKATMSAMRALEATLNVLELLGISYSYIDSKEWQKELLPSGYVGNELKKASKDIGMRMFPEFKDKIEKHGDADGILIAEHCRRKFK